MKWAAVVDGIGERFALTLVAAVWLLTLGVVAILGERVNADSLAALRTSGGKEVIGMKRSYVLALALCAGCAAGDPAGGSSLLPASDAGGGSRVPVPVVGVDSSADVVPVVSLDAGVPDTVPPADALPFVMCRASEAPGVQASDVCRRPGARLGSARLGGLLCARCSAIQRQYPCVAPMATTDPATFGSCYAERVVVCVASCDDCASGGEVCQ